ncbi:unnamed protein product [Protopolystoma xenopodis]|uniref:SEC63 domain-containing protein n=1 Tax=Protopolystoma xenopodis TaxID=117903 RepID=A0A448WVJ2_9PLAT|nr:unnamed protein product [Protopolystoma xenopodis]
MDGANTVRRLACLLPIVQTEVEMQPITRTILRLRLTLRLSDEFIWLDRWHGSQLGFWVWVEDPDQSVILHYEHWLLSKKLVRLI